jgi:hypothetical protein
MLIYTVFIFALALTSVLKDDSKCVEPNTSTIQEPSSYGRLAFREKCHFLASDPLEL